jgi:alpha-beta hydrolase superfamily lysophospholipase
VSHHTSQLRPRAVRTLVAAGLISAIALGACTADEQWRASALGAEHLAGVGEFYEWDEDDLAGEPGSLVGAERILGAPDGARAWRVLFRSTDVHDDPVIVSGTVLAPDGVPDRPRAVVSWGHPTTGAARHCAPSAGADPFVLIEGASDLLDDGYVVVASDYPGMGARGPWAYLIGASEGRSLLDAVRAAGELPEAGAGIDTLLWGHSQGGHAALFAAREAAQYAPDLDVHAVAVAAPAVELAELLADDIHDSAGVALGSYAFWAYHQTYGSDADPPELDQILTDEGVDATEPMASRCLIGEHRALHHIADPLVGKYLERSPTEVDAWSTRLDENTPTAAAYAMPVMVAQGEKDGLVRPATTADYVEQLCRSGQPVEFRRDPTASHLTVAVRALPDVQRFFARALDGERPVDTCPR